MQMAAQLTGLRSLAEHVRSVGKTEYYIKGFLALLPEDYSVFALSCVTYKVVGSATEVLLADGRLLQKLPELSMAMEQELEKVEFVSGKFWEILADPTDMSGADSCTQASLVAYSSYVLCEYFLLSLASESPWKEALTPVQSI